MKIESVSVPDKGLIIKSPHIEKILKREKTWEIRGQTTKRRGFIALIKSGAKEIVGVCRIVDVIGPLTLEEMKKNLDKHCDEESLEKLPYPKTYAWVLDSIIQFTHPVKFENPSGAVIWVNLPETIRTEIKKRLYKIRYYSANITLRQNFLESLAEDLRSIGHQVEISKSEHALEFMFLPKIFDSNEIKEIYKRIRDRELIFEREFIEFVERTMNITDFFINGSDLNVETITPEIKICKSKSERYIYHYLRLLQAVPNSPGVGRRFSALVFDKGNGNKIMGIIGLSEMAYSVKDRDEFFEWNRDTLSRKEAKEVRKIGLKRLMQLGVCMAVPPYNYLYGGKLMAFLALSNPIQEYYLEKYKAPLLGLISTTATSETHSSMYNRIHLNKLKNASKYKRSMKSNLYVKIGKTSPYTTLIISKDTINLARELLKYNTPQEDAYEVPKKRTIRTNMSKDRAIVRALRACGLDKRVLRLNSKALYFGYLHDNNLNLIKDPSANLEPVTTLSPDDVAEYWKKVWIKKAIEKEYLMMAIKQFDKTENLLSKDL